MQPILLLAFLNESDFIFLYTVKGFQVFQSNANNSILYKSFFHKV